MELTREQRRARIPGLVTDTYDPETYKDIQLDAEARAGGMGDSFKRAIRSGDNVAYQIYKRIEREIESPVVPGYDPTPDLERYKDRIPGEYIQSFLGSRSPEEFQATLLDMEAQIKDQDVLQRRGEGSPVSVFTARALSALIDVDTPLAVMAGGLGAAGKVGRAARLGRSMLAGGVSEASLAAAGAGASTTGDWTDIPVAGFMGMAFGSLGGLGRGTPERAANQTLHKVKTEFSEAVADGHPLARTDLRDESFHNNDPYLSVATEEAELAEKEVAKAASPQSFSIDDVDPGIPNSVGENELRRGGATVGAAQLNPQGSVADIVDKRSLDMVQNSQTWARQSGVVKDYFDDNGNLAFKGDLGAKTANGARRFHDTVTALHLGTDFDKLMKSGSAVAQKLAYDIMESASGIVRNNRSAAVIKDWYEKRLLGSFMPQYQDSYTNWARKRGVSRWDQVWSAATRERFNRELITELQGRAFDGPNHQRSQDPDIINAADAHDRWSALDVETGKGRPGEHAVKGYETLKSYSGYFSQKWAGSKMNRLIHSGQVKREAIRDAIAEGYQKMHNVGASDAKIWADAVVRRAMASDRGTDMNLIGTLQQDGRGFLEEMLKDAGHSQKKIDKLMQRLEGEAAKRGQAGHTKGRIDIDLRFEASNGIKIMDLVETDVARIVARRARGTAGAAALARKGIRSRTDKQAIHDAILHEQQARGQSQPTGNPVLDFIDGDKHLTSEDIWDMFSYFDAGPVAGGISPVYSRIKKLTNLALLNQLGLTQMAELGPQIAAVGWSRWKRHAGEAFDAALGRPDSPLVQELKHMSIMVPEERLFRDDFALEQDRIGTASTEFWQKADHLLNTGQRLQGYISGFYAARKFQQRVAVSAMADKVMMHMKVGGMSADRLKDIGLDPSRVQKIKQYVDNGTVEFKDGSLYKLNLDKWDAEDAEDFAFALNRHTHQVVQKAMIGESNVWFHKDGLASLFFHLKSFPMLAMQKQAMRNMRIADTEALHSFTFGLITAAAAFTARQTINGRTDRLEPVEVAKGAFGLSNMAGWLPMWTDPITDMFGMEVLKFNSYAQGIDSNIIGIPAALPTLNRMANIPGVGPHLATGGLTNEDIRALQATPIVGQMYGISGLLNAMKD